MNPPDIAILGGVPSAPAATNGGGGDEIEIIPYNALADAMSHEFLAYLWTRMRNEGVFELFFHDRPDLNFAEFVKEFTPEGHGIIGMVARTRDGKVTEHIGIIGIGQFLDMPQLKRCVGSFCFFKDYWNHRDSDLAGRKTLEYVFDKLGIDVMAGITPKANRAALAFIHRLGFKSVGEVPEFMLFRGERTSAVVSYLSATDWRARGKR